MKSIFLVWVAALVLMGGAGCATPETAVEAMPTESLSTMSAEVVMVRADERYLLVRSKHLPNAGEEARVLRSEIPVGMVRFTGLQQGDFAAADIVEGAPQPGDRVVR